jgi:hypothetical protein
MSTIDRMENNEIKNILFNILYIKYIIINIINFKMLPKFLGPICNN